MIRISSISLVTAMILASTSGAFAVPIRFVTTPMTGAAESPPNASGGTGWGIVDFDIVAHTMRVQTQFTGLTGTTTVAHIHCCLATPFSGTVGVATTTPTFPGFPAGVTAGSYDQTFNMTLASSFNAAFVTAQGSIANAELALYNSMFTGRSYLNIHSSFAGGGEIRGFLVQAPEPLTLSMFGAGLVAAGAFVKRRKKIAA